MTFEWDAEASKATRARCGFGFDFASRIFTDVTLEAPSERGDGAQAVAAIGGVEGYTLHVDYIEEAGGRRIVAARPASRKERMRWLSFVRT